ncbi:FAD-dependent oxidoreductase [Kitasatospora fiedleri]|uniref:FAD-dependent oxidoreductase n=1 Tax=Kitasatospora fiedleri TaxID=2991545 RepID=UPI00249C65F9|nr:FAD-dependent oxidoreductase [Kitasatospora fiedleri]
MSSRGTAAGDRGTAVVIGGGLAGCLAAWALHGVAERVVVVERDRYPDGVDFRPGVPQAKHGHLLLEAGQRTIDELLPGALAELLAAGATRVPLSGGLRWLTSAGWLAPYDSDLAVLTCSRPLIDQVVLERVRAAPNVEFRTGTEVIGLLGDRHAVTGVQVNRRGRHGEETEAIPAELVVDAAGRATRAAKWLSVLGAPAVPRDRVDAGVSYATRFYHRPPTPPPTPPSTCRATPPTRAASASCCPSRASAGSSAWAACAASNPPSSPRSSRSSSACSATPSSPGR